MNEGPKQITVPQQVRIDSCSVRSIRTWIFQQIGDLLQMRYAFVPRSKLSWCRRRNTIQNMTNHLPASTRARASSTLHIPVNEISTDERTKWDSRIAASIPVTASDTFRSRV